MTKWQCGSTWTGVQLASRFARKRTLTLCLSAPPPTPSLPPGCHPTTSHSQGLFLGIRVLRRIQSPEKKLFDVSFSFQPAFATESSWFWWKIWIGGQRILVRIVARWGDKHLGPPPGYPALRHTCPDPIVPNSLVLLYCRIVPWEMLLVFSPFAQIEEDI